MRIAELDLSELALCLASGELTSEAVTAASLDALETRGRMLNCVVSVDRERALEAALNADRSFSKGKTLGPLHGVPMAHKDLFNRAGHLVAAGSKVFNRLLPL